LNDLDEVVKEFLIESSENLDEMDRGLLALEKDPRDRSTLASVFRTIHTIKGTCGFLAFDTLETVAHAGESLLSRLREGELELTAEIASALLALVDAVREILSHIEAGGSEGERDYSELVERLRRLQSGEGLAEPADPRSLFERVGGDEATRRIVRALYDRVLADRELCPLFAEADMERIVEGQARHLGHLFGGPDSYRGPSFRAVHAQLELEFRHFERIQRHLEDALEALGIPSAERSVILGLLTPSRDEHESDRSDESGTDSLDRLYLRPRLGDILQEEGKTSKASVERAFAQQAAGDERPIGEVLVSQGAVSPGDVVEALEIQAASTTGRAESSIRVDVEHLDRLMNLVGELVLARNQILQHSAGENTGFQAASQRLNQLTTELQEGVMKTRLQPIGNVWNKFPRLVRDLSLACGKRVRLELDGKDTEIDKTILEAIKDPLTHLVRNSIDHGIESPEVRVERRKAPEGILHLRAYHEGGQVTIEVRDDGGGIDFARVKEKAIENGFLVGEEAERPNERELSNLIFLPGFSTAPNVTQISGRGVGMDVVKTNIEKIGGTIDVQSRLREGTTFRIRIPLTLAIIPALMVESCGDVYAIPQVSLLELVRLEGAKAQRGIERIQGAPVYRLRGKLLPLVDLQKELGQGELIHPRSALDDTAVHIVVAQADGRELGLVVAAIRDTGEIVVKPLSKHFKGIPLFAGATILGDGRVALILDVVGIARQAGVTAEATARLADDSEVTSEVDRIEDRATLLLARVGPDERVGIPLTFVDRLEEIRECTIERVGGVEVVQYRGQIMPLVRLPQLLGAAPSARTEEEGSLEVIVHTRDSRSVGLVVDAILDVAEDALTVSSRLGADRMGIQGTAVVQGRVTSLLDLPGLLSERMPGYFDCDSAETSAAKDER
jgi:two-component system, chemotaxis family, sensor kinase CheA